MCSVRSELNSTYVMSTKPCYRVVLLGDGGVGKSGKLSSMVLHAQMQADMYSFTAMS